MMENVDAIRGANMEVDTMFDSFSALEKEIDKFQKRNNVQFYIRDSRKIEAAKRRTPNRVFNTRLVYSEIVCCCIHGGKTFKSESKGVLFKVIYQFFHSFVDVNTATHSAVVTDGELCDASSIDEQCDGSHLCVCDRECTVEEKQTSSEDRKYVNQQKYKDSFDESHG